MTSYFGLISVCLISVGGMPALPAVSIEGFRKSYTEIGPVNQTVLISEQLLDSKSLFLTANTTTPYTVLYLDTKDGPLVLEIPPNVLGPIDDAWFRWVSDVVSIR